MSIFEKVNADIKKAMLAKDKEKLEALRGIKAEFLLVKTEKGAIEEISEETELKVLQKMVKQRRESADIYKSQNRTDLYEVEMKQVKVIEEYLPAQLSEEELTRILKGIIEQTGAKQPSDMGKVMGIATKQLAGKAESKEIANKVKELLGSAN
ncbi:MAG: GatB/YqeY domain-containing protein [Bacteroidota bacterium]|nr:GatB/YqeY domain-containing protein [Bacteroidota bacterium]